MTLQQPCFKKKPGNLRKIVQIKIFDLFHCDMKNFNVGENNSCNDMDLICEWDRKHNLQNNIWILQALLDICNANDLVSECAEFAKSTDVCYISRDFKGRHVFSIFYE